MKHSKIMTYDIPEWALYFLEYGECDDLSESEVDMICDFTSVNFPFGYAMDVDFDNYNEFNVMPAFGLPCKTYRVDFHSR